jgi:DnaJ-class molecular chaperone
MTETYYDILGINNNAKLEDIKQAYRRLALENHPDKGGNAEAFHKIQEAYECLSNDDKRNQYDRELEGGINIPHMNIIPDNIMEFFKMHIEETLWSSLGRSTPNFIPNKEIELPISLQTVCFGGEQVINFTRIVIVDLLGNTIKTPNSVTKICSYCNGSGNSVNIINNGFFVHQSFSTCQNCSGEGYILMNNCKLIERKCRFRHNIPIGILNGEYFIFKNEGDLFYDKKNKQFYQNDVIVSIKYDLNETNKLILEEFNFPNILITDVKFGDIYYEYTASIFEFITGTSFNLPLPNNSFIVVRVNSLSQNKIIKEFGLPQIINKKTNYNQTELRNIIITFKEKPFDKNISICESNKIIIRRIMSSQYPKIIDADAIVFNL